MITTVLCSLLIQGPPPIKDVIEVCVADVAEYQILTQTISDVDDHNRPIRDASCWRARAYATDAEQELLEMMGLQVFVLQEDISAFYAERAAAQSGLAGGPGSMGGFRTLAEINQELDRLSSTYPTVVSDKFSIGTTHEGRTIWAVRVSDQPGVDQPLEPVVWFDALHHAREPMGAESLLLFADHVLQQAVSGDEDAERLLRTRQMLFIPCANPDGYEFNRQTFPSGGGMWRKNRRPNGGSSYGVDLNRNYDWEWGPQWGGSSGTSTSDTYRGPSAGSELEIQALSNLMATHPPAISVSAHTYSDMWLFPWSYDTILTAHDSLMRELAAEVAAPGWVWGAPWQILYDANGTSMDYHYGAHGCLAFSPEIGSQTDGFWPNPANIPSLFEEVRPAYLAMAQRSGAWLEVDGLELTEITGDGDGDAEPGEEVEVVFDVQNRGVAFASGTVSMTSSDPALLVTNGAVSLSVPADSGASLGGLTVLIQAGTPSGAYELTLAFDYEGFTSHQSVALNVGSSRTLISDDFERGGTGWTSNNANNWSWERAVSEQTVSSGNTLQPNGGNPGGSGGSCWVTGAAAGTSAGTNDVDGTAILTSPRIDLLAHSNARLGYARWFKNLAGSNLDDEFVCEVSSNDGLSWTELERVGSQAGWEEVEFELTDFVALSDAMRVRFTVADDPNNDLTEGLVDDLSLSTTSDAPTLAWYGGTSGGDVIRLFLDGSPGAEWSMFWGMSPTSGVPGGGFSSGFQLPGGVRVMRSGSFDQSGRAELRIQIPAGAVLAGSSISAQALVDAGAVTPEWSNAIHIPLY
jgi:hypothetical protein